MKVVGTGLSGLVGSRVVELLGEKYTFDDISRKTGTDITDKEAILERIQASNSPVVLHFAAYTDVETAEKEQSLGEQSQAWKINVLGTQNIVDACEATGKRLIALSTDMVFPGDKELPGKYSEDETRGPTNWYAQTKYEAEKIIENATSAWALLRIAYPYRAAFAKNDSMRIFLAKLKSNEQIKAVTDHYFTPTFIDDLAGVIDYFIQENAIGVYHVGGKTSVNPLGIAKKVASIWDLDASLISETTREEFFAGRAKRPFNLSLNNGKIEQLGLHLSSLDEGLEEIKRQLS